MRPVRSASGPSLTKYTYTGQYSYAEDFGLMYYNARWLRSVPVGYDPALGRLCEASLWDAQADSIIPPGVHPHSLGAQGLDRYAYVNNSPMNYTDPSGHICVESDGDSDVGMSGNCNGGSNSNYRGGLQGSPNGWTRNRGDKRYHTEHEESGSLYINMYITTNSQVYQNTLSYKAENSYSGYGNPQLNPIMTNPAYAIDVANNTFSVISDFSWEADFYSISLKINWLQYDSGVLISTMEINNNSPTLAYVDSVTFSSTAHEPYIIYPGDMRYVGSPNNYADYGGTTTMNIGAPVPAYQDSMSVQISTAGGGFPAAPYAMFSLNNLPAGCSKPNWYR